MKYYCEKCKQECEPRLWESGAGSDCHEADLLVTYCPSYPDKCHGCEFRPLYEDEQRELTEEMAEEADAERTSSERARQRWLNDS